MWRENSQALQFAFGNKQNGQFKDKSFPADNTATDWPNQHYYDNTNKMAQTYAKISSWKTPQEISGSNASFWGQKGIRPAAISQGSLGDCWWLSGIAAVAEFPDIIKDVFIDENFTEDGK